MKRKCRLAAGLVVAIFGGVTEGGAQARPGYPAVFGGSGAGAPSLLTVSMTFSQAYDQDLLAEAGVTPQPSLQASGRYTWLAPQVTFQTRGKPLQFSAYGASSLRYYPSFDQAFASTYNAGAGLSGKVGRHTAVSANQSVSYAPTYLYALFAGPTTALPGAPATAATDYQTDSLRSYTFGTNAALDHTLGARAAVSFTGDLLRTRFVGNAANFSDMNTSDLGGRYIYALKRHVSLRLGFVNRQATYSARLRTSEQDVEIGLAVTKELSPTRRLTFGFTVGPTATSATSAAGDAQPTSGRYRMRTDAFVERQIGRSWSARATYRRGPSYVQAIAGPSYADAATFETSGFLNRRVDALFSAGYVTGQMAAQLTSAAHFTTYMAYARLRYGLSRGWAAQVDGLFYDYAFDRTAVIVPGLPDQLKRSGVRAGLTMWFPVRTEHRAAR